MTVTPPPVQEPVQDRPFSQIWLRWFINVYEFVRDLETNHFDNTIIVKQASDLINIDSSKNYMIDGSINMGSQTIEVPIGGISIAGLNGGRDTSILYSNENNYIMFTSPSGSYSGNVVIESCTIELDGTNSQVFDLDNDGNGNALDITNVNFGQAPTSTLSMGELTDYRQLLMNGCGFIFIDDGLTFSGTWTGITVVTSIAVFFPAGVKLFKEGTGFTVDNVRSDINFRSVQPTSVLFDFDETNILSDGGFDLNDVRTTATDAIPNITGASVKSRFSGCIGIRNTYVGGRWTISTEATTTIAGANTPVKMAGTTTYADLQHFTGGTSNAFTYISDQPIEVEIKGTLSFSGGNNDQIRVVIRQWDDSVSGYMDVGETAPVTMGSAGRSEGVSILGYAHMEENDRIEIWVENQTDSGNITGLLGGLVSIVERAS